MLDLSKYKPEEQFFSMRETALWLKKGRNTMMKILRDQNIINELNEPFKEYEENGYLKLVYKDIHERSGVLIDSKPVCLVSLKGRAFIKRLFEQKGGTNGKV